MNLIKKLSQNKIFYVVLILILVLVPQFTSEAAESETKGITTVFGVDFENGQYETSIALVLPKSASQVTGNLHFVSETGTSIDDALYKLGLKIGKTIGLAHCETIIIGKGVLNSDNIMKHIDFFIRTNNLTTNASVLATMETAKDCVKVIAEKTDPYADAIKSLIENNDEIFIPLNMNIENLYRAYFSKQSVATMGVIEFVEKDKSQTSQGDSGGGSGGGSEGANSSGNSGSSNSEQGGSGGGSGGSSGGSSGDGQINITNRMVVLKNGKFVRELTKPEIDTLYLIASDVRKIYAQIDDVDVQQFKNAKLSLELFDKNVKQKTFFNNGVPVLSYEIDIHFKYDEINANDYNESSLDEITDFLYDTVKEKIVKKVKDNFSELVENAKQYKTDILAIQDNFYKFHNKQWKEFLRSVENEENYLDYVVVVLKINPEIKI